MIDSIKIADFFIKKAIDNKFDGELISNLKVQKLLYYSYVWLYSLQKEKLFSDLIEAWAYGPVVRVVYNKLKLYGKGNIEEIETDPQLLPKNIKEYLNNIWNSYGQYSASALSNMTHNESPWRQSYDQRDSYSSNVIKDDEIEKFYTEERANYLLPENTVITIKGGKKTLMKLNEDFVKRLERPEYERFDMDKL